MTLSRLGLFVSRLTASLWFLPAVFAGLAVVALVVAPALEPFVPPGLSEHLTVEDLDRVLGVLASSMLAVAVFSIGAMVSALEAAASAATPRARVLLTDDNTAQTAISTFVGSFIFSVLGLIGIAFDLYGPAARVVMMGFALAVILLVIFVLIAWIGTLSNMGGVCEAISRVEAATRAAVERVAREPRLLESGARPPSGGCELDAEDFGVLQMVDIPALQTLGDTLEADLHLVVRAGATVHPSSTLLWIVPDDPGRVIDAETSRKLRACFVIGRRRTFETDPRYGLVTLSEIASRALSPAMNDPGTAIEVIAAQTRLLAGWAEATAAATERGGETRDAAGGSRRLYGPPVEARALLQDAFRAIARDGAGVVEVAVELQEALGALSATAPDLLGAPCRAESAAAAARAAAALTHSVDLEAVEAARRDSGLA